METLRTAAGIMFWALMDLVLGGMWLWLIVGAIGGIIKGIKVKRND